MKRVYLAALSGILALAANAAAIDDIDEAARTEVVTSLAETIETHFYDAQTAGEIADQLRAFNADQAIGSGVSREAMAEALSGYLRSFDGHFSVQAGAVLTSASGATVATEGAAEHPLAWYGDWFRGRNYGLVRVEWLEGNVGLIQLDAFVPPLFGGDTVIAALQAVQYTDAVIIDLRNNRGGNAAGVQFLASHFFNPLDSRVVTEFVSRATPIPEQSRTLPYAPGGARPDVPLYILVSSRTASAAEAFAYHMQASERAVIVGERTRGAANPGASFYVGHGFTVFMATRSSRDGLTGENWEGVGVAPDIEVEANQAEERALALIFGSVETE